MLYRTNHGVCQYSVMLINRLLNTSISSLVRKRLKCLLCYQSRDLLPDRPHGVRHLRAAHHVVRAVLQQTGGRGPAQVAAEDHQVKK